MRKHILTALFLTIAAAASACTNFIVGKKASADGSVMCTYNADDYGMFIGLAHYAAGTHAKGTMRKIIDWDTRSITVRFRRHLKPTMSSAISMSFR